MVSSSADFNVWFVHSVSEGGLNMGATEEMMVEKMMNEYNFNKHINFIHISWMESIIFKIQEKTKLHKNNFSS